MRFGPNVEQENISHLGLPSNTNTHTNYNLTSWKHEAISPPIQIM